MCDVLMTTHRFGLLCIISGFVHKLEHHEYISCCIYAKSMTVMYNIRCSDIWSNRWSGGSSPSLLSCALHLLLLLLWVQISPSEKEKQKNC